jgi:glycosyltransferase involved in cell wall biosynthesis
MGSGVSSGMKVTMVVPFLSRAGGGLFDSVRRLAQEVYALPNTQVGAVGSHDEFTPSDLASWAPVDTVALRPFGPHIFGWTPGLGRTLANQDPDVVHQHGLWTLNSLPVLHCLGMPRRYRDSARHPRALVISTHGMADRWALHHSKAKKAVAWYAYQRRQLQSSACIIVASASEGQTLRHEGITCPIVVIPNGVDLPTGVGGQAPWHSILPSERRILLFLGRIHRKKGLLDLLRAWASAMACNRVLADTWSLVLTGWDDGGHEAELRSVARELGLAEPHVHLTGPLFGRDRDSALEHADALVLPSRSEGMPMSVLEGLAHELPVLISDACNLPEVVTRGAGLLANPTASSLKSALEALAAMTPSERQTMGARGRDLARTMFSWRAIAQSTHKVYSWVYQPNQPKPDLPWV